MHRFEVLSVYIRSLRPRGLQHLCGGGGRNKTRKRIIDRGVEVLFESVSFVTSLLIGGTRACMLGRKHVRFCCKREQMFVKVSWQNSQMYPIKITFLLKLQGAWVLGCFKIPLIRLDTCKNDSILYIYISD